MDPTALDTNESPGSHYDSDDRQRSREQPANARSPLPSAPYTTPTSPRHKLAQGPRQPSHKPANLQILSSQSTPTVLPPISQISPTLSRKQGPGPVANLSPRRRGTVACRRCRRLRSKCLHDNSQPPCAACKACGPDVSAECSFPRRGERDLDRQFRRRPLPAGPTTPSRIDDVDTPSCTSVYSATQDGRSTAQIFTSPAHHSAGHSSLSISPRGPERLLRLPSSVNPEDCLPPPEEIVEGCRIFVTSYFQLGFIPKAIFMESLVRDPGSVSKFLLSCILSISARFTPSLIRRYGSARQATDYFLQISSGMVASQLYHPSLSRIQAFFLLAISRLGNGDRERSSMDMGVAVRMAGLLKLHSEETYSLGKDSSTDQIVHLESARRVFWMIQSQENLHSAYKSPSPFPLDEITTLLPCEESDFAFGTVPQERAAMAGTPPASADPGLVSSPHRCLFATLLQAHGLWGKVARRACRADYSVRKVPPWDPQSELGRTAAMLADWEEHLPPKHTFSVWNLRGWRSEDLHLAYLSVTMVLRLSNIVARRIYLGDMLPVLTHGPVDQNHFESARPTMGNANDQTQESRASDPARPSQTYVPAPDGFWARVAADLFANVVGLHEQIDAYFNMRASGEGFPQILVFCVYMCGSLASYLWRFPSLCTELSGKAEMMARRSLEVLTELHAAWPTSTTWQRGLQEIATPLSVVRSGAADRNRAGSSDSREQGKDDGGNGSHPFPRVRGGRSEAWAAIPSMDSGSTRDVPQSKSDALAEGILGDLINVLPNSNGGQMTRLKNMQMNGPLPNELFDAELDAFIQGGFLYEAIDGWQPGLSS